MDVVRLPVELFWASLHGVAELTRTKRFPRSRQKERVRRLSSFSVPCAMTLARRDSAIAATVRSHDVQKSMS